MEDEISIRGNNGAVIITPIDTFTYGETYTQTTVMHLFFPVTHNLKKFLMKKHRVSACSHLHSLLHKVRDNVLYGTRDKTAADIRVLRWRLMSEGSKSSDHRSWWT